MEVEVAFRLNGRDTRVRVRPDTLLVDILRDHLGLTGTKLGCGTGECGACTVLLNGRPVNSCLVLGVRVNGQEVTTIEGLSDGDRLHPVQRAFLQHGAVQCGYCTPGMIMSAVALLSKNPRPSDGEIRQAIAGNLCRCTGYVKISTAIRAAGEELANLPQETGGRGSAGQGERS